MLQNMFREDSIACRRKAVDYTALEEQLKQEASVQSKVSSAGGLNEQPPAPS